METQFPWNHMRHVLSLNKSRSGFTLVEMIATLAIISILAMVAFPYAKMTAIRNNEIELQRSLREIRTAIDEFHRDWEQGKLSKLDTSASHNGYPVTLITLVDGVQMAGKIDQKKKYLRHIPIDPFSNQTIDPDKQWRLIGYRDNADSSTWNGEDVYDVRSRSDKRALNKSFYHEW